VDAIVSAGIRRSGSSCGLGAPVGLVGWRRLARRRQRLTTVADDKQSWEVAELVATPDATIAPRMLTAHPDSGWCRTRTPCPARTLAEAALRAGRHGPLPPGRTLMVDGHLARV